MAIELSEEAFSLLHGLREDLVRCRDLLPGDPEKAVEALSKAITDLSDWIGPGVP